MDRPHWLIRGFSSLTLIYERRVPVYHLGEEMLRAALPVLVARAAEMELDDIIDAHLNRRARGATQHLAVQRDGPRPRFNCGLNPHFAAIYVSGESRRREEDIAPAAPSWRRPARSRQ